MDYSGTYKQAYDAAYACFSKGAEPSPRALADQTGIPPITAANLCQVAQADYRATLSASLDDISDEVLTLATLVQNPTSVVSRLVATVGVDNFKKILQLFGGIYVYIPSESELRGMIRNISIYYDHVYSSLSLSTLADKYNTTIKGIRWGVGTVQRLLDYSTIGLEHVVNNNGKKTSDNMSDMWATDEADHTDTSEEA